MLPWKCHDFLIYSNSELDSKGFFICPQTSYPYYAVTKNESAFIILFVCNSDTHCSCTYTFKKVSSFHIVAWIWSMVLPPLVLSSLKWGLWDYYSRRNGNMWRYTLLPYSRLFPNGLKDLWLRIPSNSTMQFTQSWRRTLICKCSCLLTV